MNAITKNIPNSITCLNLLSGCFACLFALTYAEVGDTCDIDEHMGFIKFGSRVDLYLPLDCDIKVALHDKTIGDLTEIARLK